MLLFPLLQTSSLSLALSFISKYRNSQKQSFAFDLQRKSVMVYFILILIAVNVNNYMERRKTSGLQCTLLEQVCEPSLPCSGESPLRKQMKAKSKIKSSSSADLILDVCAQ